MIGFGKNSTRLAWALMVVFLLTNVGSAGNALVLCIGQDGHVAIKAAKADADCSDCVHASEPAARCCSASLDCEGSAIDCSCSNLSLLGRPDAANAHRAGQGVKVPPAVCCPAPALAFVPTPPPSRWSPGNRSPSIPNPRVPERLILRI